MPDGVLPKIGLAAVILFAPGGFVLGATLAARWWRKQRGGSRVAMDGVTGGAVTGANPVTSDRLG